MNGYLSVRAEHVTEKTIEKSRFIAGCAHAESEAEARAYLERVRGEHKFATHVCYAFIADADGNLLRFSDDGEPQGTAGMPILEVIRSRGLKQTVVSVTRYFGGIKLGAGGLVRAYSGAAADVLSAAPLGRYVPCRMIRLYTEYANEKALRVFLSRKDVPAEFSYAGEVCAEIRIPAEDEERFLSGAENYMAGRMRAEKADFCTGVFPV